MANVVTRGHRWPRTTTHHDFDDRFRVQRPLQPPPSPTRKNNPQPLGLVTQLPYNHGNHAFDIWRPDVDVIRRNFPTMVEHIGRVNFSCRPTDALLTAHQKGKPPNIQYSTASTYRRNFATPDSARFPGINKHKPGVVQSKSGKAAVGIVPAILLHKDDGHGKGRLDKPEIPMLTLPPLVQH